MLQLFRKENIPRLRRLLSMMLPLIGTQVSIIGMNFFDASMSGQAGNADLAGAAIGGNIWMPVQTGISGVLMAAMPLIANDLGAGRHEAIRGVLQRGLLLACFFALLTVAGGALFLPRFLLGMGLEPEVYRIALWYCAGLGLGVLPFFLITPLRSLVDTLGYTKLSMKIYMLALPINACLNYVLIFGKCGLPRLGGVGAGLATGLTFWLLFAMFFWTARTLPPFKRYTAVFSLSLPGSGGAGLKEYLSVGVPMGVSIFMETSIFGVVALFVAKFGTAVIAAHQAALNFSSLIYMVPLSFSLALTIIVGVEYGAQRYAEAERFTTLGLQLSLVCVIIYSLLEYLNMANIALIYTTDSQVSALAVHFIMYALAWQFFDAVAAPIQGILRGYKDVKATFYASMLAYWGICLPVGLLLDYGCGNGPYAYWQSLDLGVCCSALLLAARLRQLQRRVRISVANEAQ